MFLNYRLNNKKAFTFLEVATMFIIVAILVLIGLFTTGSLRKRAVDYNRLSSVKSIQSALDLYKKESGFYPVALSVGLPLVGISGSTYLNQVPASIQDQTCPNNYIYKQISDGKAYQLEYCLTGKIENISAGNCLAIPGFLCCVPKVCEHDSCGDDGCGGFCNNQPCPDTKLPIKDLPIVIPVDIPPQVLPTD